MRATTSKSKNFSEGFALELHPLCTLFPRMEGDAFDALVADIKANGLREPIIVHDGMILDGGNRYRACLAADVKPNTMKFGGDNLVTYVLSANLHRRHMNAGQQAAIVAAAQDWAKAQTVGKPKSRHVAGFDTATDRAAVSGASLRTQERADAVAKASPELAKQVAHGDISLPKALDRINGVERKPKPKPEVAADELEMLRSAHADLQARNTELAANLEEAIADNAAMAKVFEADDKLGAAAAEIKRQAAEIRMLRTRLDSLMSEKNAAVRAAKASDRKAKANGAPRH